MRYIGWFAILSLLATALDASAAELALRSCPPTPPGGVPSSCDPVPMPWDNATFQFQASPSNPEVTVRMERSDNPVATVGKIIVTSQSRTHEIPGTELGFLPRDILGLSVDVSADQDGDAYITLQIFYDIRMTLPDMPGGFKRAQIGISKMQSHQVHITQFPFPQVK